MSALTLIQATVEPGGLLAFTAASNRVQTALRRCGYTVDLDADCARRIAAGETLYRVSLVVFTPASTGKDAALYVLVTLFRRPHADTVSEVQVYSYRAKGWFRGLPYSYQYAPGHAAGDKRAVLHTLDITAISYAVNTALQ